MKVATRCIDELRVGVQVARAAPSTLDDAVVNSDGAARGVVVDLRPVACRVAPENAVGDHRRIGRDDEVVHAAAESGRVVAEGDVSHRRPTVGVIVNAAAIVGRVASEDDVGQCR